jgi:hypothetical protein
MLWTHKSPFLFYQIHDSFIRECKSILTRIDPARVTNASMESLKGKGVCIFEEQFTYIMIFGFARKPMFLP